MIGEENVLDILNSSIVSSGSTWINANAIIRNSANLFGDKIYQKSLNENIVNGNIVYQTTDDEERFLTTRKYDLLENMVASNVLKIINFSSEKIDDSVIDKVIEDNGGSTLDKIQKRAVKMAINNSFSVLTGGPGTGKTYTLQVIDKCVRSLYKNVSLCYAAPTGKAAMRISESTGFMATTLHRLLEMDLTQLNPTAVNCGILIIDESSMIDIELANALFAAIRKNTKVILVGDSDQLPSIGAGAVLRDLLRTDFVPRTCLVKTFRQSKESTLFRNIKSIKDGKGALVSGDDFSIIRTSPEVSNLDYLLSSYFCELEKVAKEDIACLVPFRRKGSACSNNLNLEIQKILNPSGICLNNGIFNFRKGDMVMQLVNRKECVNGEVGQIATVSRYGLSVLYAGNQVDYELDELSQLSLAYAMSIHKSQGSEYKTVITCLTKEELIMAERNLLYTAITRAKQRVVMLCDEDVVVKAIKDNANDKRETRLSEKLYFYHSILRLG